MWFHELLIKKSSNFCNIILYYVQHLRFDQPNSVDHLPGKWRLARRYRFVWVVLLTNLKIDLCACMPTYLLTNSYLPNNRVGPDKRVGRHYCYINLLFVSIRFSKSKRTVSKLKNAVVTSALLLTFVLKKKQKKTVTNHLIKE